MSQNDVHTILRAEPIGVYREMSTCRIQRLPDRQQMCTLGTRREGSGRRPGWSVRLTLQSLPKRVQGGPQPDDVSLTQQFNVRFSQDDPTPGGNDLGGPSQQFTQYLGLHVAEVRFTL